jgi:ferric-dicitrate binding protein FerR (iron transport regulator)
MEAAQRITWLLERYQQQSLSLEERAELMILIDQNSSREQVTGFIEQHLSIHPELLQLPAVPLSVDQLVLEGLRNQIQTVQQPDRNNRINRIVRYAAAAALLIAATCWYLWQHSAGTTSDPSAKTATIVAPAASGAMLTLSDGTSVQLDAAQNGLVAEQEGSKLQLQSGRLSYDAATASGKIVYNTLSTARGKLFQLLLPDGSKAWLNAASSITYPTAFAGNERLVSVTGEVYFEVSPSPQKPFRIRINNNTTVQVLGTSFNINAYTDEPLISATLLEGSIKIKLPQQEKLLQPGQQLQCDQQGELIAINQADISKVIAWKEGIFNFRNAGIEEVMRQISRWYDVDIVYEKGIPSIRFEGMIGRDLNLNDVLHGLKETGIHFKVEGKQLTVLP